jgi:hypothetical protein
MNPFVITGADPPTGCATELLERSLNLGYCDRWVRAKSGPKRWVFTATTRRVQCAGTNVSPESTSFGMMSCRDRSTESAVEAGRERVFVPFRTVVQT